MCNFYIDDKHENCSYWSELGQETWLSYIRGQTAISAKKKGKYTSFSKTMKAKIFRLMIFYWKDIKVRILDGCK